MFIKLIGKTESVEVFECARYYSTPILKEGVQVGWDLTLFESMGDVTDHRLWFKLIWGADQPYRDVFAMNSKGDTVERIFTNHHKKKAA